jgi:uncharacterized caspase-like protein
MEARRETVGRAVRSARLVHSILVAIAVCLSGVLCAATATAETRVALVIGNSAYAHGGRLANPANDAAAVAQSLRKVGFTVALQTDLGRDDLEAALKSFTRTTAGADIALVYYAGHGIEKGGVNYLIPVDATLASDADIDFEAVPLDLVMHSVGGATKLKVVILDACRNNPFRDAMRRSAGTRGIGQGLAKPPDPEEGDMLVAYAAEAGSTAEDGSGANSPFATALAKHLPDPGVDVRIMFGRIRDDVRTATGMRQEPAVYESLGGEQFDMAGPATEVAASAPSGPVAVKGKARAVTQNAAAPDPKMMDLTYWQSVQGSNDPTQLKSYLDQYPNGAFAALAREKIAALQAPAAATPTRRLASVGPSPTTPIGQAQAPAGRPLREGRLGRFDGPWRVSQTCLNPQDPAHPFTPHEFVIHVHGGRVHGSRGVVDQPGWLALDGLIEPDGSATLAARGAVGRGGPNAGAPYSNVLTARFTDNGGAGQWAAKGNCQFTFTRSPGDDAQAAAGPPQ